MIFVSTGGHRHKSAAETAMDFYRHGIVGVELSGGLFSPTYEADLMALPKDLLLQIHNYFPPPKHSFVLNLASLDPEIAGQSICHVRMAMHLAILLRHPVYSLHAGFCIDPKITDLGRKLGRYHLINRDIALNVFGERMSMLAEEARREGVRLLIENNVLEMTNLLTYGEDPLLLTHPDEIVGFMTKMPSNIGLLLDLGHLKVSSKSLNFDLINAHETVKNLIQGYHLSDNDGITDSNDFINCNSWFLDLLIPNLDYYSLEIYKVAIPSLVDQYIFLTTKLAEKLVK